MTNGKGADKGCECVGFQAHDVQGHEHPNMTLNNLVQSVKPTGTIGVVGVFVPQDPGGSTEDSKHGEVEFDIGYFFQKGQSMGTGQCNVKAYNRQLMELIHIGKAKPSFIVSHNLPLTDAVDAYKHFDERDNGWTDANKGETKRYYELKGRTS